MNLLGQSYLRQSAIGKFPSPRETEVLGDVSPAVFDQAIERGTVTPGQLVQLGLVWKGNTNFLGWGGGAPSLNPGFRAKLAYVMAHRYLQLGQIDDASQFFAMAERESPPESPAALLAARSERLLKEGKEQVSLSGTPGDAP